ncbi:MAG: response regulator [Chloroflexota bacterium]
MTQDAEKVRVFVVDDHELIRLAVRSLIENSERMEVIGEAASGEDALASDALSQADVVICDMMLPDIDGVEVIRRIGKAYPSEKVLVLSEYGEEYLIPALEAGADGYLLKSNVHDEIVDQIDAVLAGDTPISSSLHGALVSRLHGVNQPSAEAGLTERQLQVLRKLAEGFHLNEVAAELSVGLSTVNRDVHDIHVAFGTRTNTQAVSEAQRRGLL